MHEALAVTVAGWFVNTAANAAGEGEGGGGGERLIKDLKRERTGERGKGGEQGEVGSRRIKGLGFRV